MRKTLLMTTAAAALLISGSIAGAQDTKNQGAGPSPAPAAQQKAPAEKMAPSMKAGHKSQTTGQASSESKEMKAKPDEKSGAKAEENTKKMNGQASESSQSKTKKTKESQEMKSKSNAREGAAANEKSGTNEKTGAAASENKSSAQSNSATRSNATTGQGAAGARANLTTEQRTKITTVIKRDHNVRPVEHVNFDISVGVRVPRTLHFYPLPAEVISVYPAWRGYEFILVGDQILVINPRTYEIVDVIPA